ncbi:MAG: dehydratase, partial [Pseudomonadota bacterium]
QPFHLSDEGGRAGFFGALSASGWHTAALFMRSLVLSGLKAMRKMSPEDRAAAARAIGPGLGFDDLRWRRPAFAGDTLRFFIIPRTVAPFPGRADWRRLESQAVVLNQDDAVVMSMTTLLMSR